MILLTINYNIIIQEKLISLLTKFRSLVFARSILWETCTSVANHEDEKEYKINFKCRFLNASTVYRRDSLKINKFSNFPMHM